MLEYIVRPFGNRDPFGRIQIPSTPRTTTDKAVLTWGAKATMPQVKPSGLTIECCHEDNDEFDRTTDDVRIENPDDSSQFVMVKRATKLSLHKTHDASQCDNWGMVSVSAGSTHTSLFSDPLFGPSQSNQQEKCKVTFTLKNNTASPSSAP